MPCTINQTLFLRAYILDRPKQINLTVSMSLFAFQQQFPDEASCLAFMETQRRGENGANRYCPHCGSLKSYRFAEGKLFKCGDSRKKFTIKLGTMCSDSHVPLHKRLY